MKTVIIWLLKLCGLGKWAAALEGAVSGYQAEEQAQVQAVKQQEQEIDHALESEKKRIEALPAADLDRAIDDL